MKPTLSRRWRIFGWSFSAVVAISLAALTVFQIFFVIPTARRARQLYQTVGLAASRESLARNPDNPAALRGMASEVGTRQKDFGAAIGYLQRAVKVEPDNLENHFLLAIALLRAGRGGEATSPLQKLAATGDAQYAPFAKKALVKLEKNPRWGLYKPRPTAAPDVSAAATPSLRQ